MTNETLSINRVDAEAGQQLLPGLTGLLKTVVEDGAAVSFVLPFSEAASRAFWRDSVLPDVARGGRVLLTAQVGGAVAGSVQLITSLPPNQPHRAEVAKLLVLPAFRRRGIARRLMLALEDAARERGRTLITLDTRTGDTAERLYARLGYKTAGVIPNFALDPDQSESHATTYMYKELPET